MFSFTVFPLLVVGVWLLCTLSRFIGASFQLILILSNHEKKKKFSHPTTCIMF